MKKSGYKYENIKLSPGVFKELLIQLYDGKQFTRKEAIETIVEYHVSRGGILEPDRNMASVFKGAIKELRNSGVGEAPNPAYGVWKLKYKVDTVEDVKKNEVTDNYKEYQPDEIIGRGPNAVYVYYYPCYKKLTKIEGRDTWPCKIGRTDGNPINRIMEQAGTCYPEMPHLGLVIKCEKSAALEKLLHCALTINDRHMESSPGKEWYLTTPDEIKRIYHKMFFDDDNDQQLKAAG